MGSVGWVVVLLLIINYIFACLGMIMFRSVTKETNTKSHNREANSHLCSQSQLTSHTHLFISSRKTSINRDIDPLNFGTLSLTMNTVWRLETMDSWDDNLR
jgi:hypothetical protein